MDEQLDATEVVIESLKKWISTKKQPTNDFPADLRFVELHNRFTDDQIYVLRSESQKKLYMHHLYRQLNGVSPCHDESDKLYIVLQVEVWDYNNFPWWNAAVAALIREKCQVQFLQPPLDRVAQDAGLDCEQCQLFNPNSWMGLPSWSHLDKHDGWCKAINLIMKACQSIKSKSCYYRVVYADGDQCRLDPTLLAASLDRIDQGRPTHATIILSNPHYQAYLALMPSIAKILNSHFSLEKQKISSTTSP